MTSNLSYYRHSISFPCVITTGVGRNQEDHEFFDEDKLKDFLLSEKSILMWNCDSDLQAMCNLSCIKISVFTYRQSGSSWFHLEPDYNLVEDQFKSIPLSQLFTIPLYYEDGSHYDLLLTQAHGQNWQNWNRAKLIVCDSIDEIDTEMKSQSDISKSSSLSSSTIFSTRNSFL